MIVPVTAEEKICKKNDVKARSLLLMALPNEHQLTFSQYTDAKTMFAAMETRFGGNESTKKTQKALLKQQYENFNASSSYTANLSDTTVYAILENQPKGSQLVHKDLEQIHDDDLEKMDLKWQLDYSSNEMPEGRVFQLSQDGTLCQGQYGYQDNSRNQESSKRTVNMEDSSSKAMLAIDGIGFDWSDMAEEQVQTNMALMAFSDSEVYNDKSCSKTCLKNYETLKKQCDDLIVKLNDTEFKAATYKRGLAIVEDQLVTFRKNEVLFSEEIAVLKREVGFKEYEIGVLKSEFEKVKQEEEGIDFKIAKFDNASKDLDKLLASQITDNSKKGLDNPQMDDKGFVDSGCSRHINGNIAYLKDFKEFDGGYVTFGGGAYGGRISGKGTLKTDTLDFEDVYFVKELKFNLFSVSQMCDKKNYVLFTNSECLVLSPNFKLPDESQILLKIPKKGNMYSFDVKNIVPK
ncbi:hypothetical protein Tco_0393690 [Tanacetum coccineum]